MGKDWDDPEAWKAPISKHGYTDGGDRVAAPTIGSARNPNCRRCHRHQRGWKNTPGCECEKPDFDTVGDRLKDRNVFIAFLTEIMAECLRVLKPGGYMLVWSIPRTSHWTATAIEDAGFEIRDAVHHIFGQGFPKSLNIGKALSKMARGAPQGGPDPQKSGRGEIPERMALGMGGGTGKAVTGLTSEYDEFVPDTPEAEKWGGWGTALKPAVETWWLVRKPIEAANVATQVLRTGTGAINIDGARIPGTYGSGTAGSGRGYQETPGNYTFNPKMGGVVAPPHLQGRYPSHLVLSHSPECESEGCAQGCPVRSLDEQSVEAGGASRFFHTFEPDYTDPFIYTGKASKTDKNADLADAPPMMELRDDITEEDQAFVLAELRAAGVVP